MRSTFCPPPSSRFHSFSKQKKMLRMMEYCLIFSNYNRFFASKLNTDILVIIINNITGNRGKSKWHSYLNRIFFCRLSNQLFLANDFTFFYERWEDELWNLFIDEWMCFLKSPEVGVFDGADISFELPGSTNEGVKSCFIRGNICRIFNISKKKDICYFRFIFLLFGWSTEFKKRSKHNLAII